jgi:hypothetical protein
MQLSKIGGMNLYKRGQQSLKVFIGGGGYIEPRIILDGSSPLDADDWSKYQKLDVTEYPCTLSENEQVLTVHHSQFGNLTFQRNEETVDKAYVEYNAIGTRYLIQKTKTQIASFIDFQGECKLVIDSLQDD